MGKKKVLIFDFCLFFVLWFKFQENPKFGCFSPESKFHASASLLIDFFIQNLPFWGSANFPFLVWVLSWGSKESCFPLQFSKHVSFTKLPLKHLLRSLSDFSAFFVGSAMHFLSRSAFKGSFSIFNGFLVRKFPLFFFLVIYLVLLRHIQFPDRSIHFF